MGLNINIKDNIPPEAITFSNIILTEEEKNIQPAQLKLFCALGFAPSILISEVRLLRNKIEHDYELPKIEDVKKAIEVAELLIETVRNKGVNSLTLSISDTTNKKVINIENGYTGLVDEDVPHLSLYDTENNLYVYYDVNCNEVIYYYLFRAMITSSSDEDDLKESIKLLINNIVIKQPLEYINIKKVIDSLDETL